MFSINSQNHTINSQINQSASIDDRLKTLILKGTRMLDTSPFFLQLPSFNSSCPRGLTFSIKIYKRTNTHNKCKGRINLLLVFFAISGILVKRRNGCHKFETWPYATWRPLDGNIVFMARTLIPTVQYGSIHTDLENFHWRPLDDYNPQGHSYTWYLALLLTITLL